MSGESVRVGQLHPGDRFVWCRLAVTVQGFEPVVSGRTGLRPGRWLDVVDDGGRPHRLHFYDSERVTLTDDDER